VSEPQFGPPREVVSTAWEISDQAKEELATWLESRGLRIPVSQVVGYQKDLFTCIIAGTSQTFQNNTITTFTFQTVTSDKQKAFDGTSTITLPQAGLYLATVYVDWGQVGATKAASLFDGATLLARQTVATEITNSFSWPFIASKGDAITLTGFQISGGPLSGIIVKLAVVLLNPY